MSDRKLPLPPVPTPRNRSTTAIAAALAALAGAACGGGAGAGRSAPPPMPVEVVTLAERPVEQATEYVGVVRSRQSTAVQPQAEGFVTRIRVRSGDRVSPGAALLDIDSRMQEASVASLQSLLAARRADLQHARQQAERAKTLLAAGAVSQAEVEQAETGLATAEAQVLATEAQLREQSVELGFHTVTAPTAGVVGDVPVRVGDRVTRSTLLTTIDGSAGLELYIAVPVKEAAGLRLGLPVHIVDDRGGVLATERLSFVAAAVDADTQSVLAKATLEKATGLRTEQIVRARVVWTEEPALTVPIVALNRQGGQFFAFVAESGKDGATVARQRAVEPGPVVGNDYVLLSGLAAGERLIVSGVQKIGDGAPVQVLPAKPLAAPPAAPGG